MILKNIHQGKTFMQEILSKFDSIEILNDLPFIKEKLVVDFANGIEVVNDHIRFQKKSNCSFFSRAYDSLTGVAAKRQAEINKRMNNGISGTLEFLVYLAKHMAKSQLTITKINENIIELSENIAELFTRHDNLKKQFETFKIEMNQRVELLEHQTSRLNAKAQIDEAINKWAAGRFSYFPLAGRLYVCLEELNWGCFGDFIRFYPAEKDSLIEILKNRVIIQLNADSREEFNEAGRHEFTCWFAKPQISLEKNEAFEAMYYLADSYESDSHPFIYYLVNQHKEPAKTIPRIFDSVRIADAVVSEVFKKGLSYDK